MLLEPNTLKAARSVLRGEGDSDVPALPDINTIHATSEWGIYSSWDDSYGSTIAGQINMKDVEM